MTEILSSLEFQISVLLFVALGGYLLASQIKQSAIIGQILLGILIGPSILGLLEYTEFVKSIAHLGAIILLFVVGLEFRLKDIAQPKYFPIAALGVVVPWVAGFFFAKAFHYDFGSAVFVGTALTATSIAITANVLRELQLLQTETAKAIIGAAVLDDVLGLLLLAFSKQLVFAELQLVDMGIIVAKALAFLIVGAAIGIVFMTRIMHRIDTCALAKKYPELAFIFTMLVVFMYSLISELLGLSAIVGAFLAGVSMEGVRLVHSQSYKHGAEYLRIIFASIFFVSLGIIVDLRVLTGSVLLFILLLTLVAILTKLIGCGIPAKWMGLSPRDAVAVGVGMSPRGEVAMIVALIGINSGLIGQEIYVSVLVMSLLTTLFVPVIFNTLLYKDFVQKKSILEKRIVEEPVPAKAMGVYELLFGIVLALTLLFGFVGWIL